MRDVDYNDLESIKEIAEEIFDLLILGIWVPIEDGIYSCTFCNRVINTTFINVFNHSPAAADPAAPGLSPDCRVPGAHCSAPTAASPARRCGLQPPSSVPAAPGLSPGRRRPPSPYQPRPPRPRRPLAPPPNAASPVVALPTSSVPTAASPAAAGRRPRRPRAHT
ncbi:hypothetical protein BRADI_4g18354v3 [Brachypodium distachyon]|uniref:Uncharacterized protein n=1 Tax=Brachypodium distachyon TaxID=15368 RepID=A0A2K2CNL4_BRADI|nr:hypothetical protein BRADI_4g18354v3 [Brachypodium distachyon]